MKRVTLLLFAASLAALGQTTTDGISTSASKTIIVPPDEAVFNVVATTTVDVLEQQVVEALQDTGITAQNLVSLASSQDYYVPVPPQPPRPSQLYYQFGVTVPFAKMRETIDKLEALRKKLPANFSDLQFTSQANASQKIVDDARRNLIPQLMAEARRKAEFLANAANVNLGNIQSVSDSSSLPYAVVGALPRAAVSLVLGGANGVQIAVNLLVKFGVRPY